MFSPTALILFQVIMLLTFLLAPSVLVEDKLIENCGYGDREETNEEGVGEEIVFIDGGGVALECVVD
jgi:hypothetical protein